MCNFYKCAQIYVGDVTLLYFPYEWTEQTRVWINNNIKNNNNRCCIRTKAPIVRYIFTSGRVKLSLIRRIHSFFTFHVSHSLLTTQSWVSIHKAVRLLTAKSRDASKPRNWMLYCSYRTKIGQASQQRCRRGACQISERLQKFEYEFQSFETSRDLAVRRLSV